MNAINTSSSHKKALIWIGIITAFILSIPLIAMQFNDEIDWQLPDFIIIGTLLIGAGLVYEFYVRRFSTTARQVLASAVLLAAVMLIWAELAVGIFGSPFAGS